jgi:hypothetical protein
VEPGTIYYIQYIVVGGTSTSTVRHRRERQRVEPVTEGPWDRAAPLREVGCESESDIYSNDTVLPYTT